MSKPNVPLEVLIEQLHGSDWTARCDAARLLGQSRDPRAVDALLPANPTGACGATPPRLWVLCAINAQWSRCWDC